MTDILALDPNRRDNADLIYDAYRLGWLPPRSDFLSIVFDATYGEGVFWKRYRPGNLLTNDTRKPADRAYDFTEPFPEGLHGQYRTVVFDPPYKLNGKPTEDDRYGTDERVLVPERMRRILAGVENCASLVAPEGHLLVKCMDQVSLWRFWSQTEKIRAAMEQIPGFCYVGHLHLLEPTPRPQARQSTPRNNYSTLMAFKRNAARRPRARKAS